MLGRWAFWVLAPALLAFAAIMVAIAPPTTAGRAMGSSLAAVAVLLVLSLYDADRFNWAGRIVAAAVILAYVSYFIS